ncbi:hypothetical protein SmJEL517_g02363 [Synchytrium microbalum]|uniref:G-patch domain-containing protein n=1 Tax=Synchytrium microbalum TaxID=1806994 RepID=A0A507CCU0_9FUNG|nr:uncharacterized protein SmJEL517_g02363 [Synchytrium microbalum]TPX35375.1 hypothetical protein SmJEL517_g02363 [Synchytrium microbalum]
MDQNGRGSPSTQFLSLKKNKSQKPVIKRPAAAAFEADHDHRGTKRGIQNTQYIDEVEGRVIKGIRNDSQASDEEEEDKLPLVIPLIVKNQWRLPGEGSPAPSSNGIGAVFTEQQPTPIPMASSSSNNCNNGTPAGIPVSIPPREEPKWGLNVMKKPALDKPIESTLNLDTSVVEATPMTEDERAIAALISEARGETTSNKIITSLPILAENAVPGLDDLQDETDKYRHDVALRPDEPTLDEYDKVPVDQIGAAMLRGMGWKEGEGLGKNKTVVTPILSARRPALLGLGAKPQPIVENKADKRRIPKPNEYKPEKAVDTPPPPSLSRRKGSAESDEDADVALDFRIDDKVVITAGKNKGVAGYIIEKKERSGGLQFKVQLKNGDVVKAYFDEVKLYSKSTNGASDYRPSPSKPTSNSSLPLKSWLRPHIRLVHLDDTIVSKSLAGGKHLDQSCTVQDVIPGQGAIVKTSHGDIVDHIVDRHVETYVPSAGKTVLVVKNEDTELVGQTGRILEKDKRNERALVQLEHDFEIRTFAYDDIAEYVEVL